MGGDGLKAFTKEIRVRGMTTHLDLPTREFMIPCEVTFHRNSVLHPQGAR